MRLRLPLDSKETLVLNLQRCQMVQFALQCRDEGKPLDVDRWLFGMAWLIRALAGPHVVQYKGMEERATQTGRVLSRWELWRWAVRAGLDHVTPAQLQRAEICACRAPRERYPMARLGGLLRLTAQERERCQFWHAEAIDETRAQRRARKAEEKRERNRKAKAARDKAKRQSGERKSREQYRADCAARREREQGLCRELGIKPRQLRNRLKAEEVRL
jgi:hypothetical protein